MTLTAEARASDTVVILDATNIKHTTSPADRQCVIKSVRQREEVDPHCICTPHIGLRCSMCNSIGRVRVGRGLYSRVVRDI
jgi:hypothetical protein